ncbi:MAG TPA: biopolymer transporter ExbD [Bacteroidales bacterium]|jgi:biopolymer transport protein ExbD|nr:biopolymer transporter ExbD [Bacteroidales bacterium]HNY52663.1 biopolymer transporter ExbD [Bacteroidales bacterium]HOG56044.1 biopolymer transporter ExbD [Bacteroidales bacterium]HPX43438.1 biopolymer transporter ExbD [Bacteroidales bacterium]
MPKIRLPKSSPHIDMTPMVDLFCVVLIFLMLTTTIRQPEPANVDTPFSISETPLPDFNIMTFLLSPDGKVFMNFDNGGDTLLKYRPKILAAMGERYGIEFTETELRTFEKQKSSMGVPIGNMKQFLNAKDNNERTRLQVGIPMDSTDNQLSNWILVARQVNPNIKATIKGDSKTSFEMVEKVLDILQDRNVNRFNLITSLEAVKINLEEIQQ